MAEEPRAFRRFPRIPAENAVLVRIAGTQAPEVLATTRTVSAGGCMFVQRQTLGVGTAVELLISLPGRVIKAQGRVVWENERASGAFEVGVEFLRINPEDRRILEATIATQASARK
jgi:c-di-GMP-binding flagellar brake protein YcgR